MTAEHQKDHEFHIQIDRVHYTTTKTALTGADLRALPNPAIGADRDLYEVVPGHPDEKILDGTTVKVTDGKRFFTAPAHINPGSCAN